MFRTKVLQSEKYFKTKNAAIIAFGICGIVALISLNRRVLFHLLGIDEVADIALTFGVGMGVISIATVFTRRRYVSTGYLELTSEQIIIERKEAKQKYDLRELIIWITRSPYYAGDIEGGPRNYFFGDNWLEFDWKGNRQKFEFAIDSHYKSNQLLKLLDLWKAKGVDYYFKQQPDFFRRGDD